ncbi:hypothetical protein PSHT_03053 [Puccinia striiformis]|uniref:Protein farnesyltransferase/geranylgeranyltransferase type-1 subunit alpha n=1 Tax=Puccinia striiformis TaxID=27350 RepID=A0A2S4WGA7_9BASI|nr:hypothetical protein PSHT_03053 [Puccinia striiformis]
MSAEASTQPATEPKKEDEEEEEEDEEESSIVDDDELWKDITPIPQADAERPMVQIAYHPEYRKAMNLFRGLLEQDERSERALKLTSVILQYNGAHYTVWNYRSQILKHLHQTDPEGKHIQKELGMLNKYMGDMRKSYQAWQHRALMVELLEDVSKEIAFVDKVLKADTKNYHTWTYRQSLLCRYNQPEMWAGELSAIEGLLVEDIRNNSAWNHRFFLSFDTFPLHSPDLTPEQFTKIVDREIEFTKQQILKAPNNPSAWNYLRGVLRRGSRGLNSVEEFVIPLTKTAHELDAENSWPIDLNKRSDLPVPAAVELLADIYSESQSKIKQALEVCLFSPPSDSLVHPSQVNVTQLFTLYPSHSPKNKQLYDLLAEKLDPIRKGYWQFRSQRTGPKQVTA